MEKNENKTQDPNTEGKKNTSDFLPDELMSEMMEEFLKKYSPSIETNACDFKTTDEIAEMFSSVIGIPQYFIIAKLKENGFRTTIIGSEFRWILKPVC